MGMTMNANAMVAAAHDEVKEVLRILGHAAAGGARSKPTIAQLNEIVSRLENADAFLRTARPATA